MTEITEEIKFVKENSLDSEPERLPKDYSEMSFAELVKELEFFLKREDRLQRSEVVDTIKSVFYKKLAKERLNARNEFDGIMASETAEEGQEDNFVDPFIAVENAFKELYKVYRQERLEYNRALELEREENFKKKTMVIEDLKALMQKQENTAVFFEEFRELQSRWRNIGQVPVREYKNLNNSYQYQVEIFYDMLQINRDLRDLDFKKNLEAKEQLCKEAEELTVSENIVQAFNTLQKLHEQWKELGPVAKEYREEIWDRFKKATYLINKKHQLHFEEIKQELSKNLEQKKQLCGQLEALLAESEGFKNYLQWNEALKKMQEVQEKWREIGPVPKKEAQNLYGHYKSMVSTFYSKRKEFNLKYNEELKFNLEKKKLIVEEAQRLKESTDWRKTADEFIALQKQWKEIGPVPRKESDKIRTEFRTACDEFFGNREKSRGTAAVSSPVAAMTTKNSKLKKQYDKLSQDIYTYENNIGFFSNSKNSSLLVEQMKEKIAKAKKELEDLEKQLKNKSN